MPTWATCQQGSVSCMVARRPTSSISCHRSIQRYVDVRVHTVMNKDRLEMLGAQRSAIDIQAWPVRTMGPPCRSWKPTATSYCFRHTGQAIVQQYPQRRHWSGCGGHPKTRVSRERWSLDWLGAHGLAGCFSAHCGCSQCNQKTLVTCIRPPKTSSGRAFRISSDSLRPASGLSWALAVDFSSSRRTRNAALIWPWPGTALSG